jgi:hypothetical protein
VLDRRRIDPEHVLEQGDVLVEDVRVVRVGEGDRVAVALAEGALGDEVAEQDRLVLGEVAPAGRGLRPEERGHEHVTLAQVADVAPDDAAPLVEDPQRVVRRRLHVAAGLELDAPDGLAVVVGDPGHLLERGLLVDETDAVLRRR